MKTQENLNNHRNICLYYGGRNIPHSKGSEKGVEERRVQKVWVSVVVMALFLCFIPIIVEIVPNVSSGLIEVDDGGGKDHLTIQEGVDAALPGDTVLVYAGTYYEDVVIDKTINLTGEDRDTTIINASGIGIFVQNVDYVNISGFTIENGSSAGIRLIPSNNSIIENNRVERNNYGIQVLYSNNTMLHNNIASNNSNYHGIYIDTSTNITAENNTCSNNSITGIRIFSSSNNNIIKDNFCLNNNDGISVGAFSKNNLIKGNTLNENNDYGLGIFSDDNTFVDNNLISNDVGVRTNALVGDTNKLINNTIVSSTINDIYRGFADNLILLNTTFNKSSVTYQGTSSIMYVQWYLEINIKDYLGNPIPNVNVKIEDNKNGTYNEIFTTDGMGKVQWIPITEYIEKDISGDTIGEKTFFTPLKIIAWNDTLVGYAQPIINQSKTVTIVLGNGTLMDLEPGWNLVSLPRIQSDPNLPIVLQSIKGQYDAVQCYNVTDNNDYWKHYHIAKPPNLNDFNKINLTIGFWIHITDPQGTTLVIFGDELIENQSITIYPGWNLLGYPSLINRTRDMALNNLNFSTDVDSIWAYNAPMQKWDEIEMPDSFVIGKGYWIHSKTEKVWDVPL